MVQIPMIIIILNIDNPLEISIKIFRLVLVGEYPFTSGMDKKVVLQN